MTPQQLLHATLARATALRNLPESTYRLQLHQDFTFKDATNIIPYLAQLGITHLYCSPYLNALHSYDVIDPTSLNPDLGSQADYDTFLQTLKDHHLSHILDTVPNHMGVATNDNPWWNDVLENGPASPHAHYFDIDWNPPDPALQNKLLLPVLNAPLQDTLAAGHLHLSHEDGRWYIRYHDRRFPLSPTTHHLFTAPLPTLLAAQHYQLDDWRPAATRINYRRFFDLPDLAALAIEHPDVFDATQSFTLSLCATGHLTGLRIDHPDGLANPQQYLQRLQSHYLLAIAQSLYTGPDWPTMRAELLSLLHAGVERSGTPRSAAPDSFPLYVTVEKILAPHEPLPPTWPTAGTTGYDPLAQINNLFLDPTGEQPLTQLYQDFTGDKLPFETLAYQKKLLILDQSLPSELHSLATHLHRLAPNHPLPDLQSALRQFIACFPTYRTYITDAGPHPSDHPPIHAATHRAIQRNPHTPPTLFHLIQDTLLNPPAHHKEESLRFATKFQQLTAPATAKGIEDTAFYCNHRLLSLNEVGNDPAHFATTPDQLHTYLAHRATHHPHALTPLTTHDTKRSEDVRARLNVLSELPHEWRTNVEHWRTLNTPHKHQGVPTPDEEYLLYQTLLGTYDQNGDDDQNGDAASFLPRIQAYLTKALRESKLHTSWTSPNQEHESAVTTFISSLLSSPPFLHSFLPFQQKIAHLGLLNSLAQTLLKLTIPGVPDTYQGSELLSLSLVDPDNRRPVDYPHRQHLLSQLPPSSFILHPSSFDSLKLHLTTTLLHTRRQHPGLFTTGSYTPLHPTGPQSHHLFAFSRHHQSKTAIVLLPRLPTSLPPNDPWQSTHCPLPHLPFHNLLTNQPVPPNTPLPDLLANLPLVVLLST